MEVFFQFLSFDYYISSVYRSTNFHLRNIGIIRPLLSMMQLRSFRLILITVTQCYTTYRRAVFQNQAGRIVTSTSRCDHITGILIDVYWLNV